MIGCHASYITYSIGSNHDRACIHAMNKQVGSKGPLSQDRSSTEKGSYTVKLGQKTWY